MSLITRGMGAVGGGVITRGLGGGVGLGVWVVLAGAIVVNRTRYAFTERASVRRPPSAVCVCLCGDCIHENQ